MASYPGPNRSHQVDAASWVARRGGRQLGGSGLTACAGTDAEHREETDADKDQRKRPPQYIAYEVIDDRVPVGRKRIGQYAGALHLPDLLVRQPVEYVARAAAQVFRLAPDDEHIIARHLVGQHKGMRGGHVAEREGFAVWSPHADVLQALDAVARAEAQRVRVLRGHSH